MKKNIFITLLMLATINVYSQVSIGTTGSTNNSVSLEFNYVANDATTQRGIILPWVNDDAAVVNAVPGTIIYNAAEKKVKYLKGTNVVGGNSTWEDLTINTNGAVDLALQTSLTENVSAGTTIGTQGTSPGILILGDSNKAMILPKVDVYSSIVNPTTGMMVYDMANNLVCFYNGTVWTFWKAE